MLRPPLAFLSAAFSCLTAMCGSGGSGATTAAATLDTQSYLGAALDPVQLFRWTPRQPGEAIEVLVEVQNAPEELPAGLLHLGYDSQRCADAVRDGLDAWGRHAGLPLHFALSFHGSGQTLGADVVKVEVSFEEIAGNELMGYTEVITELFDRKRVQRVAVTLRIGSDTEQLSGEMVYALLLHELGHALGIVAPAPRTGHSTDARDVMYPTVHWMDLSPEDRIAIRELYALAPTMHRADESSVGSGNTGGNGNGGGFGGVGAWMHWIQMQSPQARVAGHGHVAAPAPAGARCQSCAR